MQKVFTYSVDGKDYQVVVTYKRKKNIAYRLRNDTFIVTSPHFVSLERIKQGLDKFARSLIKRVEKDKKLNEDDRIFLFGEQIFYNEESKEATFHGDIVKYESKEDLINNLKKIYAKVMVERTRYYENLMGVFPSYKIKIKKMKTRLGSNSRKTHSIAYADNLYPFSIDILDSLVVHELAHHFIFDHSEKFYQVVLKYCPNYHKDNKKLKKRIYQ